MENTYLLDSCFIAIGNVKAVRVRIDSYSFEGISLEFHVDDTGKRGSTDYSIKLRLNRVTEYANL